MVTLIVILTDNFMLEVQAYPTMHVLYAGPRLKGHSI